MAFGLSLIVILVLIPAVATLSFHYWLVRKPGLSTKDKIDSWDVFIKGISTFSLVAAGLSGIFQYVDTRHRELEQQKNELAQKTREFNINLYNQANDKYDYNFRIFHEAVDVAATLASSTDLQNPDARIARMRFERLYWGQMAIMESLGSDRTKPVEAAMIVFRKALLEWERTGQRDLYELSSKNLDRLCLELAHACGESLAKLSVTSPKSLPVSQDLPK